MTIYQLIERDQLACDAMRQSRRTARLFIELAAQGNRLSLDGSNAHYLADVLRMRVGDGVTAFDGRGQEWRTRIQALNRRHGVLELIEPVPALTESPLELTLVQALVKSEAMDTIVQKATELGVTAIWPAITEWSVVRLDAERLDRKLAHWQRIARSACEQSGRHRPPEIRGAAKLADCLAALATVDTKIVLDPSAPPTRLPARAEHAAVVVGPEGGFGPSDEALLDAAGCRRLRLGARVLRADTAAITICALAQQRWGDLG